MSGCEAWLDEVPGIVERLEAEWSISLGRVLGGGSEALVIEAIRRDGTLGVLKVLLPHTDEVKVNEIDVMQLARGRGCARIFEADHAARAMLLERLGPPLESFRLPQRERLAIMARTAQALWQVAPPESLLSGADKGRWLADFIRQKWEFLNHPCSERAMRFAVEAAERRVAAHNDRRVVLVHGDIHEANTLQAGDGWKLIDPDGIRAEPEYDLGVIMRLEPVGEGGREARELANWLAETTGTDAAAIFEWAAAERLSTALVCTEAGYEPTGREVLAHAELVASRGA